MLERFTPNPTPNVEIRRSGRFTDLKLPSGEIRIIYDGNHVGTSTAPTLIPSDTDGIFLEEVIQPKTKKVLNSIFHLDDEYRQIGTLAQSQGIPIVFHDINEKMPLRVSHKLAQGLSYGKILSPTILTTLTSLSTPEALILCAPLLLDSISEYLSYGALRMTEDEDKIARVFRAALRLAPFRRPYVLRLRNALWAVKINWALENGLGSHFTTIVGGLHTGMEKYLQMEAEGKNARILRATSPIWPIFADLESYYSFRVFSQRRPKGAFDINRVYEVPKLKAIAQGIK